MKKAKDILVAVVGAGGKNKSGQRYNKTLYAVLEAKAGQDGCGYSVEMERVEASRYPFLAADRLLRKDGFDRAFLIGTEGSSWEFLCQDAKEEYGEKETPVPEIDNMKKDRKKVEAFLEKCMGKKVEIFLIKEGRTKEETDENIGRLIASFSQTFQNIEGDINITLDVSNGLRSIPMYVQAVMDYFSVLESNRRDCSIQVIYGMFEAKEPVETGCGQKEIAPMLQMDVITSIRAWTSAVREFYANGSVIQLLHLLEKLGQENIAGDSQEKAWSREYHKALSNFSFAMNSNNLELFSKSIQKMQQLLEKDSAIESAGGIPGYIHGILKAILENLTGRFVTGEEEMERKGKYSSYMFSIAQWYFEQERFGDTAIALQEGLVTYVMETYAKECHKLLEKKIPGWGDGDSMEESLFQSEVREAIRKNVFERDDGEIENRKEQKEWLGEWKEWRKEYDYICKYIRNSAMLLSYHDKGPDSLEAAGENEVSIETAQENIERLFHKIAEERAETAEAIGTTEETKATETAERSKMIEKRLEYLLGVNEYDVFISYRRSYNAKDENDGVVLVVAIKDYLEKQGLKVFVDIERMEGVPGSFSNHIRMELFNSKCCLAILGNHAFGRDYKKEDEYYKEIMAAVDYGKEIFVVSMEGFDTSPVGEGVLEERQLEKVVKEYQRIGSPHIFWGYHEIMALREQIWAEIDTFLKKGERKPQQEGCFLNYSNHPSGNWGGAQIEAAQRYGKIIDMPFPNIPPDLPEKEMDVLVQQEIGRIKREKPSCVLCQGEFTFTYRLINHLKANKIKAVAACSERRTVETVEDGKTIKKTEYEFKGFREY